MKIRNLDTFYWVSTLGSFRAAAIHLNISQPAISARIHMLEQDLGAWVFLRDVRNAELTPEGRKLLPYAERSMALEQQIIDAFSSTTRIVQTIRLGAAETIVTSWLPEFLAYVGKTMPGIAFELSVDTTNNLRNALLLREVDLAFLMGPVAESSIANNPICGYEMVLSTTPDIASQHTHWSAPDIAANRILTFSQETRPTKEIRSRLVAVSDVPLDMTTSTSVGALIELACSGYGICALPRAIIQQALSSGKLVELNTDLQLQDLSFTASYVQSAVTSEMVRKITESLTTFLEPRLRDGIYFTGASQSAIERI
ncbi:DNA-binding transcriptional regulator, LysR family [Cohaesibacter sp. ES.047]|uniref:LysR family transcriptional regulator n=1 Tax=Cohaesibacter sp. ES.047 TaxID=1798205 RepID=UPI000BB67B20|nr:LysR family transcriptional regulator [Cohaesibacter sp. ES.047]SNY91324.1 DNA-binding transcriptional regulator, LysR family [Cohaesibacter sp. ES.047]